MYWNSHYERSGRPPKATPEMIALPVACSECGQAVGHYDDCSLGINGVVSLTPEQVAHDIASGMRVMLTTDDTERAVAQAYANRVWAGQSPDVKRDERIARVKRALAGQNLPFEGVVLP
jgi:hypothetical protein